MMFATRADGAAIVWSKSERGLPEVPLMLPGARGASVTELRVVRPALDVSKISTTAWAKPNQRDSYYEQIMLVRGGFGLLLAPQRRPSHTRDIVS